MSATTEQNRSILAALAGEIAAVLLYISVAGINITIKATGKVPKGTQDKNSRRKLTPRPQSSTTYWLASGLTPQLVFSCSPESPTEGWYRPYWATRISTYENAQNTRSQTNLIEAILQLIAPDPGVSSGQPRLATTAAYYALLFNIYYIKYQKRPQETFISL